MNPLVARSIRPVAALLVIPFIAFGCSRPPSAPAPDALPVWTSNLELADRLGEPEELLNYTIRPPKGFTLESKEDPTGLGGIAAAWQSPTNSPLGQFSMFAVIIVATPENESPPPPSKLRRKPGPKSGLVDFEESAAEKGLLGGLPFEYVTTKCFASKTRRELRGFQYASPGKHNVLIMFQGAADDEQSFKVAEAAARTLRKK